MGKRASSEGKNKILFRNTIKKYHETTTTTIIVNFHLELLKEA